MKTRKIPMRRCIGCREMREKRSLIRVVRNQEGDIQVDATGRMSFVAPAEPGGYRLFVYVLDGHGGAGTGNFPFYVREPGGRGGPIGDRGAGEGAAGAP